MENWGRPVVQSLGTVLHIVQPPVVDLSRKPQKQMLGDKVDDEFFIQGTVRGTQSFIEVLDV